MYRYIGAIFLAGIAAATCPLGTTTAQEHDHHQDEPDHVEEYADMDHGGMDHDMWMTDVGGGWHLMAMGHIFPSATLGAPFTDDSPLNRTAVNFPHAAAMMNLESPGSRLVFRFMPNFEGLTLPNGEPTFGGWGEGFIDARHPHTVLHEAMLSYNAWDAPGGAFSLSAGRGFAPYGTDDPMYRPVLKYPTNHHLSQILERWTANAVYLSDAGWGVEVGLFDGDEPESPWDLSNFGNFGNSFSTRLSHRFGTGSPQMRPWELSASYARVRESHGNGTELTELYNTALRHDGSYGFGSLYGLVEASMSDPEDGEGYFSLLGEVQPGLGRHRPFARVEYATRPEYPREAAAGDDFFRYDHGVEAMGATRWLINSVGYGYDLTELPLSARPFVEMQHNRVWHERGPASVEPEALFGADSFFSFAAGVRLFLGGGPMRMGSYGVLDPMSAGMQHGGMDHGEMEMDHGGMDHGEMEMDHGEMDHGEMDHGGMHGAMGFIVGLLDDDAVREHIAGDPELRALWEAEGVQPHVEMMRRMHGDGHDDHEMHGDDHPNGDPMGRVMELVTRLLDEPEVQARIHAEPTLHEAWEDPAVQRDLEMMREMHDGGGEHHHDHGAEDEGHRHGGYGGHR